ncbi:MAG: hypothetical protein AAF577_05140 [Pseudomonadota bacterium]
MAEPPRDHGPEIRFVIFGAKVRGDLQISRERHRASGLPDGLTVSRRPPDDLQAMHRVKPLSSLYAESAVMTAVMTAEAASTVLGRPVETDPVSYLADTLGIITALAEAHGPGAVISDLNGHFLRPLEAWMRQVHAHDPPDPRSLVHILVNQEPSGAMFLSTRGMRTLGAPDIAVPDVTEDWRAAAVSMLERFVMMAGQGIHPTVRRQISMEGVPEGLEITEGADDFRPYFDNRHITIQAPPPTRH